MDPRDILDPWGYIHRTPHGEAPPAPLQIAPYSSEEEQGILPKIANWGMGGIGWLGSTLEKTFGGRAIRGALGGKPEELLSIIPGSDTFGLTDEKNRVSGRDLLRQWGMADNEDSWGNFAGGLGLELATDPGMYLGFGNRALTKAGDVAKKAGALQDVGYMDKLRGNLKSMIDRAELQPNRVPGEVWEAAKTAAGGQTQLDAMLHEPVQGLFSVNLPFRHATGAVFGQGQTGANVMETLYNYGPGALGKVHEAMKTAPYVGLVYRNTAGGVFDAVGSAADTANSYRKSLFDNRYLQAISAPGREAALEASGGIKRGQALAKKETGGWMDQLLQGGSGGRGEDLRMLNEKVHPGAAGLPQVVQDVSALMETSHAADLARANAMGIPLDELQDLVAGFGPRRAVVQPGKSFNPMARPSDSPLQPKDSAVQGRRNPLLRDWLQATEGINEAHIDPLLFDPANTRLQQVQHIKENYLPALPPQASLSKQEYNKLWTALDQKAQGIVDMVQSSPNSLRDPTAIAEGVRLFGNHPVVDSLTYKQGLQDMFARAHTSHGLVARTAGPQQPGTVRALDALAKAGLSHDPAAIQGGTGPGTTEFLRDYINKRGGIGGKPITGADVAELYVPADTAKELLRINKSWAAPQEVSDVGRLIDSMTNLFRTYVTNPFPAFHTRNLAGGQVQNLQQSGAAGVSEFGANKALQAGGEVPWANTIPELAGQTAPQATRSLAREMWEHGLGGRSLGEGSEVLGAIPSRRGMMLEDLAGEVPGYKPKSLLDALKNYVGMGPDETGWHPLDVQGYGQRTDKFAPVVGGKQVGNIVESANRGTPYLGLRRSGYSPESAASDVLGAQFDYSGSSLTPFEKTVMRRLIPFYTYSRFNLPHTIEQIAQRPGNLGGAYARVAQDLREKDKFVPEYLGTGLAAPVGEMDDKGQRRYLTRLDMPWEQAVDAIKPGGVINTAMGLLGQINPLLKGPLEYATNRQFYTGRDLEDIKSMTGSVPADQLAMNSPLARLWSTARQVMDPRRWDASLPLTLGTGIKMQDVDIPKYQGITEREYIENALKGLPGVGKFEKMVVRPEAIPYLTPQEYALVRLQKTLEQRAREEAARKRQIMVNP